jgi:hypothetical protein
VTRSPAQQRPILPHEYFLDSLIRLHTALDDPIILDCSGRASGLWLARLRPTFVLDLRPFPGVTHVGNWRDLPALFAPKSIDCAVWDPIHVPNANPRGRYGRYVADEAPVKGKNVVHLFAPFLVAVRPILDPHRGTLVVKMADINTANAYQWQAFELWKTAQDLGWHLCGRVGVERPPAGDDPKWIRQFSMPTGVTDWLVFHVAARCPQRIGLPRPRNHRCLVCGKPFRARSDAKTCSPAHRQALHRHVRTAVT